MTELIVTSLQPMPKQDKPFWITKTLEEMTQTEWESLCDGCGQCCLIKLEDEQSREVYITNVSCHLLDIDTCRCSDYPNRCARVSTCMQITPKNIRDFCWLPETCAYRCLSEQRSIPDWHPLVTGDQNSVHRHRVSIRSYAVSEDYIHPLQLEMHIIRSCD